MSKGLCIAPPPPPCCCRLQAQQKDWLALQAELLAQGTVLRAELSNFQLERIRLEGELSSLRETNQDLDLSNARLTSQYQVSPRCSIIHTWKEEIKTKNKKQKQCSKGFFIHVGSETIEIHKEFRYSRIIQMNYGYQA